MVNHHCMRTILIFFLSIGTFVTYAQTGRHLFKIIIDSSDGNPTFTQTQMGRSVAQVSHMVITNETTGESDTSDFDVSKLQKNADIEDSNRFHYLFDNCVAYSYFGGDSVNLQFQNNGIELPKSFCWDRLLIHIVGDSFYADYVYTNLSMFKLKVVGAELSLRRKASRRGEHLEGRIKLRCAGVDPGAYRPNVFVFQGPFDVVIQ